MSQTAAIRIAKNYAAWLLLIWLALAVYFYTPYYKGFLSTGAKSTLFWAAVSYSLAAPAAYFINWKRTGQVPDGRAYQALCTLQRLGMGYRDYLRNIVTKAFYPAPKITREERTNLLFMLVKLFFLPLMLTFLFSNITSLQHSVDAINNGQANFNLASFNSIIYPFILSALLLIDTAYFSFGYAVESKYLNNKVVSVDPTFLGWFSALICYPPLNGVAGNYVTWYANDYVMFHNRFLTAALYVLVLLLMFVYVAASVALGAKASNLTNRGIVDKWPYSFIRHPAYISKNLAWWLTLIPVLTPVAVLSMAIWSFIYFLRAITEERHLMMLDNGYREYSRQVRWRFIPGLL